MEHRELDDQEMLNKISPIYFKANINKYKNYAAATSIMGLPIAVVGNMILQDKQGQRYGRTYEGRDYDKLADQYIRNLPDSLKEEAFYTYSDNRRR